MANVESSIDVNVPVTTAYNQWTQFEQFPQFMSDVESVNQLDDTHLHWRVKIAGVEREFDAEITEQLPDQRIAWRSTSGVGHAGVVTFHQLEGAKTRVMFPLDMSPETLAEIARYTKLFWINTGPYNNLTARKFLLALTRELVRIPSVPGGTGEGEAAAAERLTTAGSFSYSGTVSATDGTAGSCSLAARSAARPRSARSNPRAWPTCRDGRRRSSSPEADAS